MLRKRHEGPETPTAAPERLKRYQQKRNFDVTSEPAGSGAPHGTAIASWCSDIVRRACTTTSGSRPAACC